jgi:cytochrome P450
LRQGSLMTQDNPNGTGMPQPARLVNREAARALAASFDIRQITPEFLDNPYPTYEALLSYAPIHQLPGGYLLTSYADCMTLYKDAKLFSSDKRVEFRPKFGDGLLYEHHTTSLIFNDPPLHTRVRKIMAGALSPRAIAELEAPMSALVDRLLLQMSAKTDVDLIADFAAAVPIEVIGNLLGIPENERDPLRGWSLDILGALEPVISSDQLAAGEKAVRDFCDYLRILVADRRRRPGDPDRDVLTRLIQGERDGEKLTEIELLQNCIFILNAGHETTTNLIGNALVTLTEWPDAKRQLIAEPTLMRTAIEEFLRFDSPVQLGNRLTTAPTTLSGVEIPEGTYLTICIGGANRDPAEFKEPDQLNLARQPNRHLGFGSGVHVCAGVAVARMEGRIALAKFLARYPNYRLTEPPTRGGRARFRGYLSIPARLE